MKPKRTTGVVVTCVAALLVVIGSLTPWISLSTPVGSIGFSGTDGHLLGTDPDGTVTLVLGLVVGFCCGFAWLREDRILPAIGVLVACRTAAIALYDLVDLGHKISEAHASVFGSLTTASAV